MSSATAPKGKVDKDRKIVRIVKRRRKDHGGHHGGSWKVAYADFVTAMMAFFMVMWLLSMDQNMKDAIEGYFSNPVGFKKGFSSGNIIVSSGNSPAGEQKPPLRILLRAAEERRFTQLASDIREKINGTAELKLLGARIEAVRTNSGLRIELIESGNGQTFFPNGSATMTPVSTLVLRLIGEELLELKAPIILEGHTDSHPFGTDATYTNWELSADRANAARRALEAVGIQRERVVEVRGMADRHLRVTSDPLDPANRRISILLPFTVREGEEDPANVLKEDPSGIHRET